MLTKAYKHELFSSWCHKMWYMWYYVISVVPSVVPMPSIHFLPHPEVCEGIRVSGEVPARYQ